MADGDVEAGLALRRTAPNDSDRNRLDAVVRPRINSLNDFAQRGRLRQEIQ